MASPQSASRAELVARGILGSQILSVPFACALSSTAVVLACRFLSKTSTTRPPLRRYFEFQSGATRPTRMILARFGAVLVATVCVVMTLMELTVSYLLFPSFMRDYGHSTFGWHRLSIRLQSCTQPMLLTNTWFPGHRPWSPYYHRTSYHYQIQFSSWTHDWFKIHSLVSIGSQSYFSDKILRNVSRPKLFFPLLVLMGIGSLLIGTAATISLRGYTFFPVESSTGPIQLILPPLLPKKIIAVIRPFHSPTVRGISVSEGLFWAYLAITTLSSLVLSFILIGSYLKDRRAMILEARRAAEAFQPSKTTSVLRFFLSTYSLVFIFDFMCLITSIVSASPNFEVAFNASKAFLVLQKLMVRVMAISYRKHSLPFGGPDIYALVDGVPKNPIFSPPNEPHLKALYATPSEPGFKAPKSNFGPNKSSKSKLKNLQSSVSRTLNKYESEKQHKELAADDAEIFSYSYPPNSACSMTARAVRTPGAAVSNSQIASKNFKYDWEPITHNLDQAPSSAKRSQYRLSPGPTQVIHPQLGYSQFPPSMPSIPPQFRENQPLPALPRHA
ncbi:hypothetical protein VP01_160g11 [Puccinia sorghi]|uniref:Uncharacterized protein n=1 Tax=Puccinia sorghi TaxID=27349 RepID=A0A0L6VH68_9BASI|nr:hypothetical protein VP01_160g11 [Puccinia sorghi]